MDSIELSFIVPAYNCEKYVEDCINSLLDQDLPKSQFEVVIINDGSTDSTPSILSRLAEANDNIVLVNQENKGRHEARNLGASLAKGRYIWFIDADDKISQNCMKSITKIANEKALDVFSVALNGPFMPIYKETKVSNVISGKELLRKGVSCWAPWNAIFRRSFYAENDFKFKLRYWAEDQELLYRIYYKTERFAKLTNSSCYYYLSHPESTTAQSWNSNKLIDLANLINLWADFIENEVTEPDIIDIFEKTRIILYMQLVNNWKNIKDEISFDDLLSHVNQKPKRFYGTFAKKLYQRIAVYYPHFFVNLKDNPKQIIAGLIADIKSQS